MLFLTKSTQSAVNVALREGRTTGSMSAASTTLNVADASAFRVGDGVIVAVGGESGLGLRGTTGVGGIYAGTDVASVPSQYYTTGTIPKALITTITNIVGNTITLAAHSVVATDNATVWLDNYPIWAALLISTGDPEFPFSNKRVNFPEGDFAFSQCFSIVSSVAAFILGTGTRIVTPDGSPPAYMLGNQAHGVVICKLEFRGNFNLQKFGLDSAGPAAPYGATGVVLEVTNNAKIYGIIGRDGPQKTVGLNRCSGTRVYRTLTTREQPLAIYIQWHNQTADGSNNWFTDCEVDCNYLDKGFETFRSSDDKFIRCGGRNVVCAMNTAGGYEYVDFHSTIEANSRYTALGDVVSFHYLEPVMNVNSNIDGSDPVVALGGTIRWTAGSQRILQEGYIDADHHTLKTINVNANNPDVVIDGGDNLHTTPGVTPHIEAPDWFSGNELYGATIQSTGLRTIVRNMRVKGTANPTGKNIYLHGTGSVASDNVADVIGAPTQSGNMTNAEYAA